MILRLVLDIDLDPSDLLTRPDAAWTTALALDQPAAANVTVEGQPREVEAFVHALSARLDDRHRRDQVGLATAREALAAAKLRHPTGRPAS